MVGDHVAGQADAARPGPVAELRIGRLAADILGDPVVVQRVGAGHGIVIAAHPFDPLGGDGAFPQADQPEPCHAPAGELVQLLVRDRVEGVDRAPVRARELVQPDVGALGHQHESRHPGRIAGEGLQLLRGADERWDVDLAAVARAPAAAATEPPMQPCLLLRQDADGDIQSSKQVGKFVAQQPPPVIAHEAQLTGQRVGGLPSGFAQELQERPTDGIAVQCLPALVALDGRHRGGQVGGGQTG